MKEIEEILNKQNIPFEKQHRVLPTFLGYMSVLLLTFIIDRLLFEPKLSTLVILPISCLIASILIRVVTKPKGYKLTWL